MRKKRGSRQVWCDEHSRLVEAGERLRIVPFRHRRPADPQRIDLIIDPGPSFGAGDHPSTVMALELVENAMERLRRDIVAPSMLDAGTGTGVLAIAAKALGAGFTAAFDIDGAAIFVAQRNVELNERLFADQQSGARITFFVGDAAAVRGEFDLVAANLAGPVLVRSAEVLTRLCGNYLVLSGIAEEMEAAVFAAYGSLGMELITKTHRERWNGGLLRRTTQRGRE